MSLVTVFRMTFKCNIQVHLNVLNCLVHAYCYALQATNVTFKCTLNIEPIRKFVIKAEIEKGLVFLA